VVVGEPAIKGRELTYVKGFQMTVERYRLPMQGCYDIFPYNPVDVLAVLDLARLLPHQGKLQQLATVIPQEVQYYNLVGIHGLNIPGRLFIVRWTDIHVLDILRSILLSCHPQCYQAHRAGKQMSQWCVLIEVTVVDSKENANGSSSKCKHTYI